MLERSKRRALVERCLEEREAPCPVPPPFAPYVEVLAFDASGLTEKRYDTLAEAEPELLPGKVSWVRVVGIHDAGLVAAVGKRFGLHPLLVEDIQSLGHRPVIEDYEDIVFLILRSLGYDETAKRVMAEQLSLVAGDGYVLTFQESRANLWDEVAGRLRKGTTRLAKGTQDMLLHALISAVLDEYFLSLGRMSEDIEEVEERLLTRANGNIGNLLLEIYRLKREVLTMHRSLWPLREVLNRFVKEDFPFAGPNAAVLWADIQQDAYQVLEAVESLREMLSEMLGLYMTKADLRMNAIGQYLTLVATVFLPLNFLVGFFGMNFDNLPFKSEPWGIFALMGLMGVTVSVMVFFFARKRWLRMEVR